ncbi:obscurin-like isoform X6 [Planococcus citri]|uniref:obscurin-like isoform X6 n=1 Tax=Planococcus citri TaxID=170843 RepID=UPI0031F82029
MSTYCRITGRSRGLPKPNYFPLLPPISPADAKRLCRITGKSYGLPTHHYLPVLVAFTKHSKTACHITANAETTELHHVVGAGVKHTILKDYRYVFPVLETNPDLLQMLESKPSELSNNKYVYTVDERRCSLVFPGRLEAAVRDGDVRDIMLATHADTLLLKLRKGGSVEVDVKDLSFDEGMELYEGEGPSQEVLQRRRKRAAKNRSDSNDWRRKIFEDKERQADFEEERLSEIKSKRIKVKLDAIKESPNLCSWNNVREGLIELHADPEFDRTVGETILQFGKQDLQNFINVPGAPIISTLPQCLKVQTENVDLSVSVPGIIKQPITIGEQVIGFPVGAVIAPFHPLVAVTDEAIDNAIHVFNASKDELKEILVKQLDLQAQYSDILPLIQQVPDLAQQLETLIGTKQETRTEFGVKLALESGSKYVPGQFFDTPSGPTFVPGNIVETSMGPCFVAGFSVNTAEGVKFLPGRIVKEDQQPVFVAGQMAVTREGEKFVQGQMVCTKEGPKFIPGQTVITSEGVKFVPGQVIHNAEDQSCKFVPGQTIMTPEGPQFVSGQFTQCNEQTIFVPGQAVLNENYNWEFIPGKNMKTDDGTFVFVPGKEIVNELGTSQFVPGRMIIENGSTERFLPGLTVDDGEGNMRFVPGMQLETPEGIKFVEGMVIKSDDGDLITFAVGKVSSSSADSTMIEFDCAKTTDDIVMHDILSNFGMCFSSTLAAEGINETEVFGHMIQSAEGVEFFPGDATGLPAGKVIPGKLIKGKEMRFIPGTMIDNKFIPGQFVTTGSEEKFIPGQVIETNEGPKFVPGQVLHTTSGPKFVPGQTMETEDGPKFIPGQIIETKSGPTFIPGQVIYTEEEGSRFVPGQVVDTIEGPRFVPGRVVETGDHVTFIPGQIVETEDGLKFIAPDLEDDLEGGYQFTVQGFEVAQEELKMIQRNSIPYACFVGEMAIDSQTLHHLAQAGMAVGRQLPVDVPVVDIKSLPTTEMACKIANKLDLDVLYSVKLSHILSTLQQACQSGVALTSREIGNETLAQLLNVASECNSSSGLLETLGNALEGIIKQDMANKLQAIDGLHTFSVELAATVRDKKPSKILLLKNIMQGIVDEKSQVIDKLMIVLNGHSSTVSTVFQNLSQHNPEFVDEVLENVSNILKNNADLKDDKEVMEVLHRAIIKSVNETSTKPGSKSTKSKAQKALSSKVKNNIQLLVKSCQVAKNLDVDELHSVKLSDILSNIQQVHQSYVPLTNKEVGDGNLMQLLNLALQCDGNANLLETLGNALENVIKQENGDTLQVINDLHKLSSKLVAKVRHKKPNKVLMLKDIMKGNVEDRDEVIEKLVAALNDHETNVSAAFQHLSLQNPEFVNQVLENASDLLKNIVDVKNEKEAMEILQRAVIKTVAETSKNAATKTNKSKSQKTSSSEGSNEVDLLVKSSQVASKLRVDVLHSAKLSNILSTLQQVRQSHVAFTDEEIGDENLVQLLNLALECDSNSSLLETLGDALENVIKEGGYDKVKTINELCTSSAQLAAKIHNKKPNKVLLLKNIIKGDIEDKSEMVDTLMAMLNEQEATVTGAFHHLSLYTPDFVDKVLENASHMIDGLVDVKDEKQAMDILHKAIIKTITETGIKPGTMINKSKSQKALSRKGSKDVELLVTSSQVADNLDIDMLHSVKLSHILSSLQQIRQSHVAFTNEEVGDENVAQLLNLALECDNNSDVLETLSTALEKVIKEGTGDKIKTINDLCAISVALAAKVHDKKPNKVLLLKSVIKGNVEEKSEMVDKLVAMLNEQEATVTGAFQHLSIQIPDFVDKVLENASHMLDSLVDVKDEKQAMEILHRAIIKTIAETGVKPSLKNNKSKTQKAQTSKGGNDVELLVKSSQVANNLDVDILHSVKLSHILSSLQQVRQSYVDVPTGEVKDENLRQLLNLALECDINDSLLETLGAALENVIKQDKGDKLDIINNLHTLSIELAAKVCDKKPNKVLLLKNIVKGNVEEKTEVVDKLVAMLNDNETAVAAAFQHLSLQTPEFVDKVIENASHMLDGLINVKDEKEAIKILNKAIIKTISETSKKASSKSSKSKLQQALCSQENDNVHSLVKSCQVAKKLNLDAEHSVKLCQLLSTLQQVHQSYVPLTNEEVGDEKLMQLLNLALQCDTNSELLETLGDALETIFKKEPGDKLKAIDDLHTLSVELAANVCNKKPDKVLLLKNMVKGNVKGKGEVANKLVAMLSDHETSMSAAFQHLSSLNPEFAEKVLENASIILRSSADIKDEKEAMEVVHQAIMKAVIKTSMKPGSKTNKLKLQQALSSEESNDVHLLVKSCQVANNLDVDASHSVKLNRILSNLQQVRQSNVALTSEEVGDENLMQLLNLALECDTIPDLLETVGDALENIIKQDIGDKSKVIDDLHALSVELAVKARNKKPNKVLLLRNMINGQKEEKSQLVERLIAMLNDHETTVCVAFQHMCQQDPEFVDKVLENTAAMLKTIVDKEDEKEVMETLHRAIIKTVAETSESKVQQALLNKKGNDFNLLVKDAISLAKALGMCEVVNILNEVIKDRNSVQVLAKDTIVMEVLKRLTVMRQLAESRPNLVKALKDLHSDPYAARSDPRLRELVRESAMLMVIPEESLIKSSADIPSSIMFSDNCLAVEDFMVKTRQCGKTFLILKKGIQAVIPREAAKDVLTGRVPYTMLDENGIHYFKPLHVFNALKLPKVATNRFHNYTYIHPALLDDDSSSGTRGSSISTEDLRKTLPNGHGHHSPHHHEGMDEEFVLVKDFVTDDEEFYADKGERVKVLKTDDDDPTLMEMEVSRKVEKTMLLDCSTARYKMSIRPPRKHADSRLRDGAAVINGTQGLLVQITDDTTRSGLVPMDYLKKVPSSRTHTPDSALHLRSKKQEAKFNREVCIGELIETEEEFGKDISRVVESYLTPLEEELRPAPRSVMDNKDTIFNNLSKISTFHNGVMIAGVKYFLKEPKTIGRTLLRLERYFDEHAQYVKYEPDAQELLEKNEEIQNYFDDLGQELGDDKSLSDHLKLPIQRINDYTLLLQELIKYSRILGEDITDLERALELMLWIPTRCNDLKFITNIEGFHGNIHKLGRLIRHNWFLVKDKNSNRGRERYCFLFKARFLICKVRRISEDRVVFVLKEIIKLPEVDVKNNPSDKRSFEIHHKEGEYRNYPYTFTAHEDDVKPDWLREIQEHAKDPLTLAEHTADDLKLQSQAEEDPFEPLKGVELDISPDIEQGLDPIEKRLAHRPLKHVPEPKRPPLVIPKKRTPIFVCEDPSPSPEREPEPVPEPEPEPEMISSYTYEEYSYQEEVHVETVEEPEEECEEVIEFTGKRKPKYIPGVSRPLFHSTIRGSSNERSDEFDEEYNWWKYTTISSDFLRKTQYEPAIAAGDNAVFECEVEGVTSMTWLKDNRPLSDKLADRICITQEGNVYRLEIKNVSETDSGTYTARAENDIGVSYSTAHLIVEKLSDEEKKARAKATSPVFLVQLKDAELLESTHARFLVKVNGNPIPEIQFYKGDQLITADNEHIEIVKDGAHPGFYEMVIADVRPEDAGEYKCVASNKYSDETCSCIVTVTSEKDIFAGLQDDLSGGTPKFMWLKNGKPFSPEERFKVIFKDEEDSLALVFQNVKPEDAGLYTCVASTSHGKISCSAELTVQGQIKEVEKLPKKAKIESITKTFEGNVGSTTVIEVKATGDPLPQIRWFREGEEIVSGGRFKVLYEEETESASLVIKNLCLEDTGEYNIVAKNSAGTDSQFVNLTVKAPPKINKKLEDFTGLTGKELRLTVQVDASPKPIVQWYKDGMTIVKSSRFKYVTDEASDSYTLVIENATMDDAGLYSVVASNEFSQVSDRCHVSMESPPQFVSTITKELETLEGDYVSFTVTVEGDPLPAVKWKFNGKEIKHDGKHYKISSEDATFTLLISEVDREDAGMYSCEISNQWGSNECDGHLYVKCLPRFDKDLEDRKVKEGDCDVEFTLKLNAFPKATVKWFHDEAEITSKKKEYTIVEEGDTLKLIIKEATTKMSGIYKCRAENEVGFKETTAKLSVCTFPKFKKELSDVDVKEGETLKLTIQCAGVPEPEVKWFKDGEELYSDSRIKISRDAKRIENYHLTITLIKSEDGGEYEVRATNEMGTAVTKSLVTVLEYPRILSGMEKDIDTFETLSAAFEVVGFGVPRPTAIWYKNGEELNDSKHFAMTEDGDKYKLEISDLKSIDAGVYSVKLENSIGETSQEAKLIISNVENLRGPKLREGLKKTTVTKRQKGVLEATFVADPVPEAKWTVDDRDVNAEFNVKVKDIELGLKECTYTMTIPSTELSDTGTYKVKVTNKHGSTDSSASLTIVMEPEIDTFRDLVVPPTMPCTFEVIVKSTPEATVTWYANGKEITEEGQKFKITSEKVDEYRTVHRLSIEDCSLPDEGEYKILAKNKVGSNSQVASLKLYTEKPSFVKLLEDKSVQDGDQLQMKVRINGLPKPDVKWYKNGEEIESSDHMKIEISTEGQLSTSLTIDHFSECDVDEYKVTAKNLVGEIETSAKLTMALIEPSFGETLKRVTEVSDGEPLEISTKVMGSPIPVVQWFKDGEEIKPENTRIKSSVSPKGDVKLNIDKVDLNDCGAYKAVATNALGKSIANTAVVVNQAPKKPSFIKNLSDVTVVEGEPIKLEAQVAAFPEPRVKWLKDGHQIHPCPQYDFISAPNGIYGLTIERSTIPDLGQYSIVVSNKCGDETSNSVVRVTPADKAPAFQTQLQPTKVVEGYPAKLEVKVTGFPLPKLTWKCNGQPIKIDNENVKIVSTPEGAHCLLIEKVTKDHTGEYELVASNDIGDNSTKAQLTVASRSNSEAENEKPIFLSGLRDTSVDESSVLSMSAPFRGNPIPDVQWFKDGTLLLPDERIHFTCDGYKVGLEIQDVNMADTGFYSCALKNPYGEDSSAAHVGVRKLYQSPVFTQRFKHQQQLPKHDAKFHCRVTGVPFPSVMWHCNGLPLSNSNKIQIRRDGDVCCLTVFNVNLDDEGTYSCIASNREGTATCEAQLQVVDKIDTTPKQEPPQFMKKIGDCEIYAGMTAKFTACASGVPEPEYEWFLDNIRIHPNDRLEMEKEGSGLVRLKILASNPDLDTGTYKLRAFNPHGEVFCEAKIIFDSGLEMKHRKPVGELYRDFDKFRATGAPLPLADKPIISRMTDRHLTLSWKPSIPISPREPVTYLVEMEEQPNGKWFTARAGIRSCACDIHNLKPFVDYKFRVRVENNYGISDPSPFAITYREKLEPDPPKIRTHLLPGAQFHPDTAHYFPKDFDIERPPHDNYAQAPKFLRQEYDTQYGVKGHNVNLFWFVYGYPKPKMTYYFNDELIEMGGRYDSSYTRNGQATLFINKMLDRDVGVYEAVAVNEHGTARQRVQLRIAEYPEFLKRPEESWVPLRKTCRLEARVIGVPYPEIKWYKDWQPLGPSSRIQIDQVEPDLCILRITDLITKDEGLYSISARNIAGSISTSVYLHVEESDYDTIVGGKKGEVKTRNKKFDDIYDLGDELGRGTQGITFHAVERNTGKNLAAKVMHGTGDLRKWMSNELDILNHLNHRNIIRPYDSLITSNSFTIIEELGAGGELLDVLTRKTYITEYEISFYIRQLLLALDHMHEFNIAHLGITPGDLLISHLGGDHLKLTDFGLSRRINSRKLEPLFYGMPEFVAPEVAGGEGVNLSADMWSVGVITHLLLTGVSLFRGKHDVDTLDRIKEGRYSIDTQISDDARDFIIKLLTINSNSRLDVRQALNHRWIKMAENLSPPPDSRQINTENLRNYYNHYKDWYSNASCRTWFRRRTFDSAYRDPSRMIYPPGLGYSPAPSPEPQLHKDMNHDHKSWKDRIPSREPLDVDIGLIKNESHYQYGPDTYLLQLRDVDFPVRLREYMKVAKSTSDHIDWQAPVIRERRRFMDVMDEEIDDEQKARINQYGSADIYTLRRLKQELGARPTAHVEAEAILGSRIDGLPPFFREKPQTIPIEVDKPAELVCYAVGSPKPLVQWFKNDLVITENHRIKIFEDNQGRSILRLDPANDYDLGIYKVVARNKFGQTTARARMVIASEPGPPEPPEVCDVSDTEVLLKWKQPKEDGNTPVLCYGLQILENEKGPWKTLAENIDHEAWLVHDLVSSSEYQFRLLAMNKIGWSIPGFPTIAVTTKFAGAEKLNVPHVLRNLQIVCERGKEIIGEEPPTIPDYSLEHKHIQWCEQPSEDKYRFVSEIARGRFSIIVKGIDSSTSKVIVAKLMEINAQTEPEIEREFEIYRMMRHERIANLAEAFKLQYSSVAIFIMEKLQGADVLTYLTSRHDYSEQMVATIITQVLDALQYLHWKGYCHLNLQPDNVVMASVRSLHIKLIDFSCAQHVNKLGTVVMNKGPLEYTAPEVLCDEPAFQYSDIWSVGVLTYILLSGVSPFRGFTELETRQNITFVRYRFEHLYKDLSQEALRFLMMLFKRTPTKRPSAEECHEQRWLLPTEYLIKKREKTSFETTKLKKFSDEYHLKKSAESTKSKELESVIGGRLTRSNSIVEELEILNTAR